MRIREGQPIHGLEFEMKRITTETVNNRRKCNGNLSL